MGGFLLIFLIISPIIIKGLYDLHKASEDKKRLGAEHKAETERIDRLFNIGESREIGELIADLIEIDKAEGACRSSAIECLEKKFPFVSKKDMLEFSSTLFIVEGVVSSKNYNEKSFTINPDGSYGTRKIWHLAVASEGGIPVHCIFGLDEKNLNADSAIFESMVPGKTRISTKGVIALRTAAVGWDGKSRMLGKNSSMSMESKISHLSVS